MSIPPLVTNPVPIFFIVLVIILFAPLLLNKLKIPHIIGMIVAGVAIGPYGLNVLARDSSFEIFGQVGILYLMFLAGLEIDMYH
ncbi:MAG: cation:proton antiporter, partial [Muribaculaceae bacterium]|nr:cation:proton antiporter [Muribaculaceae bacterium]